MRLELWESIKMLSISDQEKVLNDLILLLNEQLKFLKTDAVFYKKDIDKIEYILYCFEKYGVTIGQLELCENKEALQ